MYDEYDEKLKTDDMFTFELAGIGTRFVAAFIDGIIMSIVGGIIIGIITRSGSSFAISTLLYFLYYWYFWTQQDGQTPGKRMMKIKIIKTDGSPLTSGDAVLRFIGYWVSSVIFCLGYIWAAFDAHSQGWHDKIANTYVVVADEQKQKKYVSI